MKGDISNKRNNCKLYATTLGLTLSDGMVCVAATARLDRTYCAHGIGVCQVNLNHTNKLNSVYLFSFINSWAI